MTRPRVEFRAVVVLWNAVPFRHVELDHVEQSKRIQCAAFGQMELTLSILP